MSKKKGVEIGPLTVNFNPRIRTDGEFVRMSLSQFDSSIEITKEQAVSLAKTIKARFPDEAI